MTLCGSILPPPNPSTTTSTPNTPHHTTPQSFDHYLVYWIAPTVGAVLATVLFAVFSASFLSDDADKAKAD